MLVTARLPLIDLRPFHVRDVHRIRKTPRVWDNREFVNRFGLVHYRPLKAVEPWSSEDYYCDARRAIRFGADFRSSFASLFPDLSIHRTYRRLYTADESDSLLYLDVQLAAGIRQPRPSASLEEHNFAVESMPMRVISDNGHVPVVRLKDTPRPLAAAFERATTFGMPIDTENLVAFGRCAICIELSELENQRFIAWRRPGSRQNYHEVQLRPDLRVLGRMTNQNPTPSWTIIGARGRSAAGLSRVVRSHLLRIHSERTFIAALLRFGPEIVDEAPKAALRRLEVRIQRSRRLLASARSWDVPPELLLEASAVDFAEYGRITVQLLDRFQGVSALVTDALEAIAQREAEAAASRVVIEGDVNNEGGVLGVGNVVGSALVGLDNEAPDGPVGVDASHSGPKSTRREGMTSDEQSGAKSIHVGGSVDNRGGVFGIANQVENSIRGIENRDGGADLAAALAEVLRLAQRLPEELDPADADAALRDVASMAQEGDSERPRPSTMKRIADDVLEVATKAAKVGPLLAAAVAKVLTIVGA
jgi:hypothetical protein